MANPKPKTRQAKTKRTPRLARSAAAGFTIVETLFVLAIAGIILLIVFEAIPALERSSRNNQRKEDVSTILEAVSHWELNDSGNIPTSGNNFLQFDKLTYYDPSSGVSIHADASGNPVSVSPTTNLEKVDVYNYQRCGTANGGSTSTGAGYSDVVALYALESGNSGVSSQCQQL